MKKVIMFLLLAVIMASMSAVFTSCGSDDENDVVEIDQYARIEGLWQDISTTQGDYITTDVVYEYKFNYDRTGYWRLYMAINGKIVKEQKMDFTYLFTGDELKLFYNDVPSPTVFSSHISNNTLTISNEESGTFVLKKTK